jgi:ABC-type multidrug transport system permease subunit
MCCCCGVEEPQTDGNTKTAFSVQYTVRLASTFWIIHSLLFKTNFIIFIVMFILILTMVFIIYIKYLYK